MRIEHRSRGIARGEEVWKICVSGLVFVEADVR